MAAVLVVDDDDDIRDLIALRVRREGHEVTSIGDPVEALATASRRSFDLALLDWSMPVMDGGELCRRLRELPHLSGLRVVVVTAHADSQTRQAATEAGASGFLAKPFTLQELADLVKDHVPTGS